MIVKAIFEDAKKGAKVFSLGHLCLGTYMIHLPYQ
jgi:hypothetical protein